MDINTVLPVPIIVTSIEMFKMLGMPKNVAKSLAFGMALGFGVGLWIYPDFFSNMGQVLIYAFGAIGLYEGVVKPVKKAIK